MLEQAQTFETQHFGEGGFVNIEIWGLELGFEADKIRMLIDGLAFILRNA
jgi:hypothetical protein